MTTIRPYIHRDYRTCFLPREVLGVLGEPSSFRLVVFATTAEAAWRRLSTLDMAPTSARHLKRADPRVGCIKALVEAGFGNDGAVYAMPLSGWSVVSITQDLSDRIIDPIGEICDGRFLAVGNPLALEVTDAMPAAAIEATKGKYTYVHEDSLRAAIAAALKARGAE